MPTSPDDTISNGIILNIQKMSIHDGPGIRTTVFFKGCPLTCLWCANPESQSRKPEIACAKNRCVKCGYCAEVCPRQIIDNGNQYAIVDRSKCDVCLKCVDECCTNSKRVIGQSYTPEELYEEILKDKAFYDSSGGGVTFSGGEPLTQPDFLLDMLRICKTNGINTALETSGLANTQTILSAAEHLDLIFYDVKHMDDETHLKITGVSNKPIIENLAALAKTKSNIIVRIPVIPSLTDSEANIRETADYVADLSIPLIELLPYHCLGENKYEQLDRTYALSETKTPTAECMEHLVQQARETIGIRGTRVEARESI